MRNLPIRETFMVIVRTAFSNLGVALRLLWPWLLLIVPPLVGYVIWDSLHPMSANELDVAQFAMRFLWIIGLAVLYLLAFSSVAVGWHRYSLLGELPKGFEVVRNDSATWRYLFNLIGIGILVGLMIVIPLWILIAVVGPATVMQSAATGTVVWALATLLSLFIGTFGTRMLMKLVGIAIGDGQSTIGSCLAASEGNTLNLFGLSMMLFVVFLPFTYGLEQLSSGLGASNIGVFPLLAFLGLVVVQALQTFVGVISLTTLYRFFVQGREIGR